MTSTVPDGRYYTESHEWVTPSDDGARIGITDFAQDELGDIVFVELPADGTTLERGEVFGAVESIKAVSDVYAPVAGAVVATNERLAGEPELVNEDPFGEGWLVELETDGAVDVGALLTAEEYRETIA